MKKITIDPQSTADLQQIISMLTARCKIDRIFLNVYTVLRNPSYELVVLLSNSEHKTSGELDPQISALLRDFPRFAHVSFTAYQVKNRLIEGNLFLHCCCSTEKLVYRNPASKFQLYPEKHAMQETLENVATLFDRENHKVSEFIEGYRYFLQRGSLAHAGFMMHQAFELRYRCMEVLIMGKERVTHSVRSHHRHLLVRSAALGAVFTEGHERDEQLLNQLDSFYKASRYEDDLEVDAGLLEELRSRLDSFMQISEDMYRQTATEYSEPILDLSINDVEERVTENMDEEDLEEALQIDTLIQVPEDLGETVYSVVELLASSVDSLQYIYLFGQRCKRFTEKGINVSVQSDQKHYDLLIVTANDIRQQVGQLTTEVLAKLGATLHLLAFTKAQVSEELKKNSPFFHQVIRYASPIFQQVGELADWLFHDRLGVRSDEEVREALSRYWNREANANGFYNGGHAIDCLEESGVKVLLYNQSIQQICLGLLEYYFGYIPYSYSFRHIYTLCSSLWPFLREVFPRSSEEEIRLFDDLCNVIKDTLYRGQSEIGWEELSRYDSRCRHIVETCSDMVSEELKK
ncbi:hypothetical protein PQ465_02220 [Sphingobacterium oryzagri]|uniref:HEPN domain-containing protein n=1 Tax=Sphingobacterium oryzagri TaxID=3025669 RepID=A0ABY7WPE4_9SPHI|nr:hypothetical protein [Sphingobacterium sp. KACC 22765]WDF69209.1 hypothetical protein PQ465_02220 [Sphingobacterium sp. KACC 22765]